MSDKAANFLYNGDINRLLHRLSEGNIFDLNISEPDFEEVFCIIMKRKVTEHDNHKART